MSTPITSNSKPAISEDIGVLLEKVAVCYRVPHEQVSGIKEYTIRWLQRRVRYQSFWALKGVSASIHKGEVFGVIGRNGSGKSTLLKVIARVLSPTEGRVFLRGLVAPLLELGGGFHPELTGRENVFLNSALLGRHRADTERMFPEIIEFSEIGEFIDAPLRTYSTGMVARLGFAVATCVRPDILLVDEVLSVGDAPFQRKCLDRMDLFKEQGTTIVLVTHSMSTVKEFCNRALWLDHGQVKSMGAVSEVIQQYIDFGNPQGEILEEAPLDPAEIARNILDCAHLDNPGTIYPTSEYFSVHQGTVSVWLKFHRDRPHRDAVIFHTDDSRYVLYVGSQSFKETGQEVPVLIARAGGNRRVLDTYLGTADFPEAAAPIKRSGMPGGVLFPKEEWHQLTMTWKGYPQGTVRLYLDGQLVGYKGYDGRYSNDQYLPTGMTIGMRPQSWTGEYIEQSDGKVVESKVTATLSIAESEMEIQDVRLYSKALRLEEIMALSALGLRSGS